MRKNLSIVLLLAGLACAGSGLVVQNYAIGGGGGIYSIGLDVGSPVMGVVVGQPYASTPLIVSDQNVNSEVLPGFWMEVASVVPEAVVSGVKQPHLQPPQGIQVRFSSQQAFVTMQVNKSSQAKIRLCRPNGQTIGILWQGQVNAGESRIPVSLQKIAQEPLLLVVDAGTMRKTYQFVPQR